MIWTELYNSLPSLVKIIFTANSSDFPREDVVKFLSKKCFTICKRQVEFVIRQFCELSPEEKLLEFKGEQQLNSTDKIKKQLQRIGSTIDNYYYHQAAIENGFKLESSDLLTSPLIVKIISKLESMKDYEPDFILNIRDISLDAWKETLDFEEILISERKRFEAFTVKLDNSNRNKIEHIKLKTGKKIEQLENKLEGLIIEKSMIRERLNIIIEDLSSRLLKAEEVSLKFLNVIKKAGYKDTSRLITDLRKIENIKKNYQSQVENMNKEIKVLKGKASTVISKNEELKKILLSNEKIIKDLEKIILISTGFIASTSTKASVESFLGEKSYSKVLEVFTALENSVIKCDESRRNSKIQVKNNVRSLTENTRNKVEISAIEEKNNNFTIKRKKLLRSITQRKTSLSLPEMKPSGSENLDKLKTKDHSIAIIIQDLSAPNIDIPTISRSFIATETSEKYEFCTSGFQLTPSKSESNFKSSPEESSSIAIENSSNEFSAIEEENISQYNSFITVQSNHSQLITARPKKNSLILPTANALKKNALSPREISNPRELLELSSPRGSSLLTNCFETTKNDIKDCNNKINEASVSFQYQYSNYIKKPEEKSDEKANDIIAQGIKNKINISKDQLLGLKSGYVNEHKNMEKPSPRSTIGWRDCALRFFVLIEEYLMQLDNGLTINELIAKKLEENINDAITNYLRSSDSIEIAMNDLCERFRRENKYELLKMVHGIDKSLCFAEWKIDRVNIINKIRWKSIFLKSKAKRLLKFSKPRPIEKKYSQEMRKIFKSQSVDTFPDLSRRPFRTASVTLNAPLLPSIPKTMRSKKSKIFASKSKNRLLNSKKL